MKLADFVCFEAIVAELKAADRDEAIAELVAELDKAGRLGRGKRKDIIKAVIERENEASTGIGKGVAIPHVKYHSVKDIVATVGKSSRGISFSALDKQPVYSIILLISPVDEAEKHLQAMENIFKHLQSKRFRKFLRQSCTVEDIEELIREADENPDL